MATRVNDETSKTLTPEEIRAWNEFAFFSFARIAMRKHNIIVPAVDVGTLSDEELDRRLRLVSELAHLPPA